MTDTQKPTPAAPSTEVASGGERHPDWFKRNADRSDPKAFIHTNPAYFASECASAIANGTLISTADEYMSVSLSRDGVVTSHSSFEADFDEMVRATQTIVAALERRLSDRKLCPYSHGGALRTAPLSPASDVPPIASSGEADDLPAGSVQWHCSEEDGGPDVGIMIGLGNGAHLWLGELLNSDGGDVGFKVYLPGKESVVAPLADLDEVRDVIEHHVAPALRIAYTPKTPPAASSGQDLREALAEAYAAGAEEVHSYWKQCRPDVLFESEPDFTEAASDYGRHFSDALAKEHGGWRLLADDTAWIDGRDVVLYAYDMEVSARYCPGGPVQCGLETIEYDGAVWSCFDDKFQIEIEEISSDPALWHHGQATYWRMPTPPQAAAALLPAPTVQPGEDLVVVPRALLFPFAAFDDGRAPESLPITSGSTMARRQLTIGDCRALKRVLEAAATPLPEAGEKA